MDYNDIIIILIFNAILTAIACIPFGLACKSQKELRPWFSVFITLTIANILNINQFDNFTLTLIANIFFAGTTILLFIAAFVEYYTIFLKTSNQNLTIRDKLTIVALVSPIIVAIQIFLMLFLTICIILLLKIYLKTHSPTRFFMLLCVISALIGIVAVYNQNYGIEGAYIFGNIIVTFYVTLMFATGFVALLEQKITHTLNEKNSLKDTYSHDLGNILHTILMTYDLINSEHSSTIKSDELDNLIKVKVNEASEIVKFIRSI
jgi:hypothetical protein